MTSTCTAGTQETERQIGSAGRGRAGAAGSNPGSHREGAVGRAIGVFSKENGEHNAPSGRRAPRVGWARKRSWTTGWQRPDVRDCAGLHGEAGISGTRRRAPRAWKPADERRPAQGSVQRGARNQGQPLNAATTRMRVTTATPEATRERSNERALAEARCPNSVPFGEQPCAPLGHSPAKSLVEQADCGWQWVERLWATSSEGFDARPIGWSPTTPAFGAARGRGSYYPSLSR